MTDILFGLTSKECGSKCETNTDCNFSSYNSVTKMCILYKACSKYDFEQTDFITSEKSCGPGWKLVIIGGEHPEVDDLSPDPVASNSIEVLDLLNPNNICQDLNNHPLEIQSAFGQQIDENMPLVCGGNDNREKGRSFNKCYYLGDSEPAAEIQRKSFASTIGYNNSLIVFGGYDYASYAGSLDTIEEIRPPKAEIVGQLPFKFSYGCAIGLDNTTVFLIGGDQNGKVSNKTWVGVTWNWDLWTPGAELNTPRRDHGCAIIKDIGIVVMGGVDMSRHLDSWNWLKSVEILPFENMMFMPKKFDHGKIRTY